MTAQYICSYIWKIAWLTWWYIFSHCKLSIYKYQHSSSTCLYIYIYLSCGFDQYFLDRGLLPTTAQKKKIGYLKFLQKRNWDQAHAWNPIHTVISGNRDSCFRVSVNGFEVLSLYLIFILLYFFSNGLLKRIIVLTIDVCFANRFHWLHKQTYNMFFSEWRWRKKPLRYNCWYTWTGHDTSARWTKFSSLAQTLSSYVSLIK